jgi:hypothetical protein
MVSGEPKIDRNESNEELDCSPVIAKRFHMQQIICALTLGMAGGYAVHTMFAVMGWH